MELFFATSNPGKVQDVQQLLKDVDVTVKQINVKIVEPCLDSLELIAKAKTEQAVENSQLLGSYVMCDDSGLFVNALNGFPGQHTSFFDEKVGKEKLLALLEDVDDTSAFFKAATAVYDPETGEFKSFSGKVSGTIVEPRGDNGFGYDPLFLPDGHDKTFAEDIEHKNKVSHRKKALEQLKDWLIEH